MEQREGDMYVERSFATLSAGQIHSVACGPAEAPVVLLLHQSPRSWQEYRAVLPILGSRYRAVAMDTVGFGDSARGTEPATIEHWASVAVELLDHLEVERAHVVGHHTGGVVAVELAASHGDRVHGLVLSSTPYTDAAFRRARAERPPIDEVELTADGTHLLELWRRREPFYPSDRPDLLHSFVVDALRVLDDLESGHRAVASYRMEERIHRIVHPTLVIRAPDDPFASPHADELCALLPHAELAEIPGGMVPLPDQLPDEFAATVMTFLDRLGPGTR